MAVRAFFSQLAARHVDNLQRMMIAARVSGLASPWTNRASVRANKLLRGVRQLALTWPTTEKVIEWLQSQELLSDEQIRRLIIQIEQQARAVGGSSAAAIRRRIQHDMAESVAIGEGAREWQKRAAEIGQWANGLAETINRTYSHNNYNDGLDQAIEEFPQVAAEFPYVVFYATEDNRTRDTHWALNNRVAHVASDLAAEMAERVREWNCRCNRVPLSREDAERLGIDADAPTGTTVAPPRRHDTPTPATTDPEADARRRIADGRQVEFKQPWGRAEAENVMVEVDADDLDRLLQLDADRYIPPGGEGGGAISGRYRDFGIFADRQTTGDTIKGIEAPEIVINSFTGLPEIANGRHRTRWLTDQGLQSIQISVHPDDVERILAWLRGQLVER